MKKLHLLLLSVTLCLFSACHNDIWDAIDGLDSRVTKLEELCKEMNTNISALQTIVDVLQSNDFITSVVEIKKDGEVVGYTITFGKHDPITIYHGQDGKDGQNGQDGQNGADGKDGSTPVIGVAQDTNGVYYWTLNGEWILDDNGNKLPVSGKDGQNGTNGSNGQDGADGKDGITPQLKIEDGYWYISYDNGATWIQFGKATGEDGKDGADGADGQNGADGQDGQDGDSMFQSVTQDENFVYFTLADGTVIKIAKGNNQSNDEFIFTITYNANGGTGTLVVDTFYYGYFKEIQTCTFVKDGYEFIIWNTSSNGKGASYQPGFSISIDKNITLYAQWEEVPTTPYEYVDLGLSVKWATCNVGASKPGEYGDYFAWGETKPKTTYSWSTYKWCNGSYSTLIKYNTDSNFGRNGFTDNKRTLELSDDAANVNWGGNWRIPTNSDFLELRSNCTWTWTYQDGAGGYQVTSNVNGNSIFLPAAYTDDYTVGYIGRYWTSTLSRTFPYLASSFYFASASDGWDDEYRYFGYSVRPVCP